MIKLILNIDGMHCAACASTVEKALLKTNGVESVNVNLTANNALIVFDDKAVNIDTLIKVIANAGFKGYVPQSIARNETKRNDKKRNTIAAVRIIIAVVFGSALFYVAMGHMLSLPTPNLISATANPFNNAILQLLLCLPILICGSEIFINAIKSAFHKNVNMDTLVFIGSFSSFLYSIYSLIKIANGHNEFVHQLYFDSAGMIITFILIGRFLETSSKSKTNSAVNKLLALSPETAVLIKDGTETEVPSANLIPGDIVCVKSGMSIPVDGTILNGFCVVNESMLTGESMPVEKHNGDKVYGGTINTNGYIEIKVTSSLSSSAPAKIAEYVNEAQSTKAPIAKLADKIASIFVPSVILIALIAALIWFINGESIAFILKIFVSVLVIACPCSLGLATPTALTVSMGTAAAQGILIKNGEALQKLEKVNTVIFDKTGTITNGTPEVTDFKVFNGLNHNYILALFYSAEHKSEHPLAVSVREYAESLNINKLEANNFKNLPGLGIECEIDNQKILCGSTKLMINSGIDISEGSFFLDEAKKTGKTVILMAVNSKIACAAAIADTVRSESISTLNALKSLGIETAILTGDNEISANEVASKAGIDKVYAELMPEDKLNIVRSLQNDGKIVAMVGDGINDAPSLAAADIGIAIGTGTDIAIESAEIVLIRSNLSGVDGAIKISKRTMKIIKQNLFWAFAYNCLCIPIAAGILTVFGGPLLNPMIASAAMSLSSVTVVTNSLRLRNNKH